MKLTQYAPGEYGFWPPDNPMTYQECLDWCEALESGKYRQDPDGGVLKTSNIHREYMFCCLGVEQQIHPTQCALVSSQLMLTNDDTPPLRLPIMWQVNLATFNDEKTSFADIAQIIREEILPWIAFYESFSVTQRN